MSRHQSSGDLIVLFWISLYCYSSSQTSDTDVFFFFLVLCILWWTHRKTCIWVDKSILNLKDWNPKQDLLIICLVIYISVCPLFSSISPNNFSNIHCRHGRNCTKCFFCYCIPCLCITNSLRKLCLLYCIT